MNHLLRSLAPISDSAWEMLDDEARDRLAPALAARKLVDFSGPHGWSYSATNLGRTSPLASAPCSGVNGRSAECCRSSRCGPTSRSRSTSSATAIAVPPTPISRPLDKAAHQIAVAENVAVFHGWHGAITGIADSSPHDAMPLGEVTDKYPRPVAGAVERLLHNGIRGPYALALGGEQYQRVVETAEHGGYPLLEHLRKILEGPIVWAPGVKGAIVLSLRGGDFLFESGQDLSIGYTATRRDRPALPGGELQLPRRNARGGGRAHRVAPSAGVNPSPGSRPRP